MALLQWALTCKDISIDSQSNNVTYRDAIEQVKAEEYPAAIPSMFILAMLWRRDDLSTPETIQCRIALEDDDGDEAAVTDPIEVDLENHERFRAHVPNPAFDLEEPGTVWFAIQMNQGDEWERMSALPVEFKFMDEEA